MAAALKVWDEEDTEICNDDGMIYKRKKRPPTSAPSSPPSVAVDENRERERRARRKTALGRIVKRRRSEIEQWERFLSVVEDLELSAKRNTRDAVVLSVQDGSLVDNTDATIPVVDDAVRQALACEATVDKYLSMCDLVDRLCDTREEAFLHSLVALPIWATEPRALLTSLSKRWMDSTLEVTS